MIQTKGVIVRYRSKGFGKDLEILHNRRYIDGNMEWN